MFIKEQWSGNLQVCIVLKYNQMSLLPTNYFFFNYLMMQFENFTVFLYLFIFLFHIPPSCLSGTYINVKNVAKKLLIQKPQQAMDILVFVKYYKRKQQFIFEDFSKCKNEPSSLFHIAERTNQVDCTAMQCFIITSPWNLNWSLHCWRALFSSFYSPVLAPHTKVCWWLEILQKSCTVTDRNWW